MLLVLSYQPSGEILRYGSYLSGGLSVFGQYSPGAWVIPLMEVES